MDTLNINSWNKLHRELKGFVFRRVKDKAIAEDIIQDVFLKVQAKLGQLKETDKISAWIYQITRNTIIDYYRSKSRTFKAADLDWQNGPQDLNDCVAFCLIRMVQTLPEKYRDVLLLAEIENVSQTELAERFGISYSGVKSRVQRARQMLREKVNEIYKIEADAYGNIIVCEDRNPCCCTG